MKWYIVYIFTFSSAPTEVWITKKNYDTLNKCKTHEIYSQHNHGTFNAMCVQENTFDDFTKGDFEGANLVDMRKFSFKHHSH